MIDYLARFYVNIVEPALYIIGIVIALAFILYLFTLVRGGDPSKTMAGYVVTGTFKSVMKTVKFLGIAVARTSKLLLKTIVVIFATMRDFFKSKI